MLRVAWSMLALVFFLLLSFAAMLIGAFSMTPQSQQWYDSLAKPDWTPPGWVISLVWFVLYVLMAIAAWLVYRRIQGPGEGIRHGRWAMGAFFVQLAVNAAWTPVFFAAQSPGGAFAVIVILWLLLLATTALFFMHSRIAGILMLPYVAWVTFAAILNLQIWRMNM